MAGVSISSIGPRRLSLCSQFRVKDCRYNLEPAYERSYPCLVTLLSVGYCHFTRLEDGGAAPRESSKSGGALRYCSLVRASAGKHHMYSADMAGARLGAEIDILALGALGSLSFLSGAVRHEDLPPSAMFSLGPMGCKVPACRAAAAAGASEKRKTALPPLEAPHRGSGVAWALHAAQPPPAHFTDRLPALSIGVPSGV